MRTTMSKDISCDSIVLVAQRHSRWEIDGFCNPLFVCTEMLFDLQNIEVRRWELWHLIKDLDNASKHSATLSEFLEPDDFSFIEYTAKLISQQFYQPDGTDWSLYNGISLGKCFEYDVQTKSMRRLKYLLSIKRLVECFPSKQIYCDYPTDSEERKLLAAFQINLSNFDVSTQITSQKRWNLRDSITNLGIKYLRSAIIQFCNILTRCNHKELNKVPTIVVFPTQIILKTLEIWKNEYTERLKIVIASGTNKNIRSIINLIQSGAIFANLAEVNNKLDTVDISRIKNKWIERSESEGYLKLFDIKGMSLDKHFAAIINEIIDVDFPRICNVINSSTNLFNKVSAKAILLPNDTQTMYRAFALVARSMGVKSFTPQHGYPMYLGDGNHLTSDYSFFWSKSTAQIYENLGVSQDSLFITGCPYSDTLCSKDGTNSDLGDKEIQVLIITTGNPGVQVKIKEEWVPEYILNVLSNLLQSKHKLSLTVKLHPGESRKLYAENVSSYLHRNIKFIDDGDLTSLIQDNDVIISPPSTCILQALLLNKPVIYGNGN